MAARLTRDSRTAAAAVDPGLTRPPAKTSAGVRRAAIALIAVVWCGLLAWLVLATANPVTLNRRQILDADAVVTAQVVDPAAGTCRIVRQWTGETLPGEFVVAHLDETAARPGGDWILPLVKIGDEPEVLPSLLPSHARLVYPATPEVLEQLEAIVNP